MPTPRKSDQSAPAPTSPTGTVEGGPATGDARALAGEFVATAQGLRLPDTDHSLKVGTSGPTLLEDFRLREKITHFDHEWIPGRGQDIHQGFGDRSGAAPGVGPRRTVDELGGPPAV